MTTGYTAVEKIIARAAGRRSVRAGEIVHPQADLIVIHDGCAAGFLGDLWSMGLRELNDADRVMVVMDHRVPPPTVAIAQSHQKIRDYVKRFGIEKFFDIGNAGIAHQLQTERGLVLPGDFIVSKDTHSPTSGAIGCLAIPLAFDIPTLMAFGTTWLEVPRTIRILLHGTTQEGVLPRDVAQKVASLVAPDDADGSVFEFGGPYVDDLSIHGRQVLCNVPIDVGATSAFVNPDDKAVAYMQARSDRAFTPVSSDPDAVYFRTVEFDVSALEPVVAAPPSPGNVVPVSRVAGRRIDQAFVGTCAGGMLPDLREVARVLRGRHVASGVRAFIAPSTQHIYEEALREGLINDFIAAGATVLAPGCAACSGTVAPLSDGEICISTGTSNSPGRMGSRSAEIYLASPLTVAASAVAGCIVAPAFILDPLP